MLAMPHVPQEYMPVQQAHGPDCVQCFVFVGVACEGQNLGAGELLFLRPHAVEVSITSHKSAVWEV